jgi:hypothetical protein
MLGSASAFGLLTIEPTSAIVKNLRSLSLFVESVKILAEVFLLAEKVVDS